MHRFCDHSSKNDECLRDSSFDLAKAKAKLKNLSKTPESLSGFQKSVSSLSGFQGYGGGESVGSLSGFQQRNVNESDRTQKSADSLSGFQHLSFKKNPVSEKADSDAFISDHDASG